MTYIMAQSPSYRAKENKNRNRKTTTKNFTIEATLTQQHNIQITKPQKQQSLAAIQ
jgi:hypothetical protein